MRPPNECLALALDYRSSPFFYSFSFFHFPPAGNTFSKHRSKDLLLKGLVVLNGKKMENNILDKGERERRKKRNVIKQWTFKISNWTVCKFLNTQKITKTMLSHKILSYITIKNIDISLLYSNICYDDSRSNFSLQILWDKQIKTLSKLLFVELLFFVRFKSPNKKKTWKTFWKKESKKSENFWIFYKRNF